MANVNPTPNLPKVVVPDKVLVTDVKPATPDIILFDNESVPIEVMTDLIFENIGGQELINIVRSDIVNGQNVI